MVAFEILLKIILKVLTKTSCRKNLATPLVSFHPFQPFLFYQTWRFFYLLVSLKKPHHNMKNYSWLRHVIWNALPAPEADTDAEAEQTLTRRGVRSLLMDETRPSICTLHHIRLHLFGYSIRYVIWEKISRIQFQSENFTSGTFSHLFTFKIFIVYYIYV